MALAFREPTKKQGDISCVHCESLANRLALQKLRRETGTSDCRRAAVGFVRASHNGLTFDLKPKERVRAAARIASLTETACTFKGTRIARVQRVIENCGAEHYQKSL